MSDTVWVVTQRGDDYDDGVEIVGVFNDRKVAHVMRDALKNGEVRPYPLMTKAPVAVSYWAGSIEPSGAIKIWMTTDLSSRSHEPTIEERQPGTGAFVAEHYEAPNDVRDALLAAARSART